jgi:hypothetical protein
MEQHGLDQRHRDKDGTIARKHGNTLIGTLRRTYGENFADEIADFDKAWRRAPPHGRSLLCSRGGGPVAEHSADFRNLDSRHGRRGGGGKSRAGDGVSDPHRGGHLRPALRGDHQEIGPSAR